MGLISRVSSRTYRSQKIKFRPKTMIRRSIFLSSRLLQPSRSLCYSSLNFQESRPQRNFVHRPHTRPLSTSNRLQKKDPQLPPWLALLIETSKSVGKAAADTFKDELKNVGNKKKVDKKMIHLSEAQKILEQDPDDFQKEMSEADFNKLKEKNVWIKRKQNRPTYLQSKIYRSKERLDIELS